MDLVQLEKITSCILRTSKPMQLKAKARDFVVEMSSRSMTVLEDSISAKS